MSKEQVIDFWSGKTLDHAKALIVDRPLDQWDAETEKTIPLLLPPVVMDNLPDYDACLEIGAGVGRLVKPMADVFDASLGIDISPKMVEYAKDYLMGTHNAAVILTDGSKIPYENDTFDFVYSYICFQHLQSHEEARTYLKESLRVLRPGGVIRVQTHCGAPSRGFQGMYGAYYPSLKAFALEFTHAGFFILEAERGITHPDSLWVTAQKEKNNA